MKKFIAILVICIFIFIGCTTILRPSNKGKVDAEISIYISNEMFTKTLVLATKIFKSGLLDENEIYMWSVILNDLQTRIERLDRNYRLTGKINELELATIIAQMISIEAELHNLVKEKMNEKEVNPKQFYY